MHLEHDPASDGLTHVKRIVEILPITAAGMTLISPGLDPHHIAASNEAALRFEKLQTELSEGPCLAAYHTGEAISVPGLTREARFPHFCPRALDAVLVTEVGPADALRRHQSRR